MSDFITIVGFGSLLSEKDARRTCPNLKNFRQILIPNHRRVFNKVDSTAVDIRGLEISNWVLKPSECDDTLAVAFEIPLDEWDAIEAREFDYDLKEIDYTCKETQKNNRGISCVGFDNDDHLRDAIKGSATRVTMYEASRKSMGSDIYRNDILPWLYYLGGVLKAAKSQGDEYVHNILDHAYLADGQTTIRSYLKKRGLHHDDIAQTILDKKRSVDPSATVGEFMKKGTYTKLETLDWLKELVDAR